MPAPDQAWDTRRHVRAGQGWLVSLGLLALVPALVATALRVAPPTDDGPALLASFIPYGLVFWLPALLLLGTAAVRARRSGAFARTSLWRIDAGVPARAARLGGLAGARLRPGPTGRSPPTRSPSPASTSGPNRPIPSTRRADCRGRRRHPRRGTPRLGERPSAAVPGGVPVRGRSAAAVHQRIDHLLPLPDHLLRGAAGQLVPTVVGRGRHAAARPAAGRRGPPLQPLLRPGTVDGGAHRAAPLAVSTGRHPDRGRRRLQRRRRPRTAARPVRRRLAQRCRPGRGRLRAGPTRRTAVPRR